MNHQKQADIEKLRHIKLLLLDVDGVMTNGKIIYDDRGAEIKEFHVKDGLGIRMLILSGVQVGIVTGRGSPALRHRCNNLGIDIVFDGVREKAVVLDDIIRSKAVSSDQIAFVGDDLPDLPLMRRVGLCIAVADAHPSVINEAHMVTTARGGTGAVREVCDAVLMAQGLWEKALERF
jgi:3-deoxy-D-manno-octulosonate 8-phosphate phosphatase (KDO 8-P phosphatase)